MNEELNDFKKIYSEKRKRREDGFFKEAFDSPLEGWVCSIYSLGEASKLWGITIPTMQRKLRSPERLTVEDITKLSLMLMIDPHLIFTAAVGFKSKHYDKLAIQTVTHNFKTILRERKKVQDSKKGPGKKNSAWKPKEK
jgi:hypothetical protein